MSIHPTRPRGLAALLTPIAAATLALAAQAQTFGTPLNLSNSAAPSGAGQVAVAAADVYTVWLDTPANNKKQTRFAHSSNGGASFGSPVNVLVARTGGYGPQVAADGAYVYVARDAQTKPNGPTQVYFSASGNHGMSFGPEIQLTSSPGNGATLAAVAAAGSSVHVLWFVPGATWRLFVSTSGNGGASFTPAVEVSGTVGFGQGSSMRVLGTSVHVAWSQWVGGFAEVYYIRSTDGGASFSAPLNLSNTAGQNSVFAQLALAGSNVYLGYRETEYRLIRSTDGGASFGTPVDVSSGHVSNQGLYGPPGLAASGDVLHYIWHEDVGPQGNYDVFHRSSVDDGANFGATTNLSASAPASFGLVAAEGPNAYVLWTEQNGAILVRQSVDSGASFAAAVNVAASGGADFVAAAPAGVHVGWHDGTPGEVFYRFGSTP